jgi:hypothetical protein
MATKEELKASEEALRAELKRHDWYYTYSDDGRVFRRGSDHRKKIDLMFASFVKLMGATYANAVWNECAPKDFQLVEKGEAS